MGLAKVFNECEGITTVLVCHCAGDMQVEGHGTAAIHVLGHTSTRLQREGDSVMIAGGEDDLVLRIPSGVTLHVAGVEGDLSVRGVAGVEVSGVSGSLALCEVSHHGSVDTVRGDLIVDRVYDLTVAATIGGDVLLHQIGARCMVGDVSGDLNATDVAELIAHGSVGGNALLREIHAGRIDLRDVGGDLELTDVLAPCVVDHVEGDVVVENACDFTLAGHIGGDLSLARVTGRLVFHRESVKGDLTLDDISTASHSQDASDAVATTRAIRLAILRSLQEGEISAEEATLLLAHAG